MIDESKHDTWCYCNKCFKADDDFIKNLENWTKKHCEVRK